MIVIVIIQLLEYVAARSLYTDVELGPRGYRSIQLNMAHARQSHAQVSDRLPSVIDDDQFRVLVSLTRKAAQRLRDKPATVPSGHDARDEFGRRTSHKSGQKESCDISILLRPCELYIAWSHFFVTSLIAIDNKCEWQYHHCLSKYSFWASRSNPMGTFEQYPWLLVPLIIVTVEFWNVAKNMVKR